MAQPEFLESKMLRACQDKEYRHQYALDWNRTLVGFQVRQLRYVLKLSTKQLAEAATVPLTVIEEVEAGNWDHLTISHLVRLADVFDNCVVLRFAPFSEVLGSRIPEISSEETS